MMLGVIEAFGGDLGRTDCMKLLFLLSQQDQGRHYQFFPHHYGPFSHLVMQDKRRLTSLGLLRNNQRFTLVDSEGHLDTLPRSDREQVRVLRSAVGWKSGREL
ncbi:MAG: hypothetical protein ACOC9B_05020, partial [Chloroflexota bacterium]